jgi:hypothetical protein
MSDWYEQAVADGKQREWIDEADSGRRLLALAKIHKRIKELDPESDRSMPPLIIFSPPLRIGGLHRRATALVEFAFVYLSPLLEYESNDACTFQVAHEIAHAVLAVTGRRKYGPRTPAEVDNDEEAASNLVVEKWKLPKIKNDERRFLKLLEKVLANG